MDYSNIGTNEDNTFLILMSTLPIDIKLKIYQKLRLQEMVNLSLVCRALRRILHREFWPNLKAVDLCAEYDALFPSFDIPSFQIKMNNRNNLKIRKDFIHLLDALLQLAIPGCLEELILCHLKAGINSPLNGTENELLEIYSENFFSSYKLFTILQESELLQNVRTLDISGIRLTDGGLMLREIGHCIGKNLKVIRMRNCNICNYSNDDVPTDQHNLDIFLKKCSELRVLDIGGCGNLFYNNSFEHITPKLEKFYAQLSWISDEQLALIAKKCGANSLQELSIFLLEQMNKGILRSMQRDLKKLCYLHVSAANRADTVFYLERLPPLLNVLVLESAFRFCDFNTLRFLQMPYVQSHALSELTLNRTDATTEELMNIAKLRRLQKLSFRLCPNLNDSVCAYLVDNIPNLTKIYIIGCGHVSGDGMACFLQLVPAKLRWIEAGEQLTDDFFENLISRLDQMYNSVEVRPESANDSRIVHLFRNFEYKKWNKMDVYEPGNRKSEDFFNRQCHQTETRNLHPFVVFAEEAEIHTFLDHPLSWLTKK